MSPRPHALDVIGDELRATAARDAARPAGRRGWRARGRRPLVLLLVLAVPATGYGASRLLSDTVPAPRPADIAPESRVVAGSVRVLALRVADPAGGAPWTLRSARSSGGQRCLTAGQVEGGRFGITGLDGRFRRLPAGIVDACADASGPGPWLAGARTIAGGGGRPALTVVSVLAGGPLRAANVTTRGGTRQAMTRTADGSAALAVVHGTAAAVAPVLHATYPDGRVLRQAFMRSVRTLVPGPFGPWRLEASGGDVAGRPRCAQLIQSRSDAPHYARAIGPIACGDLRHSPVAFALRRLAPGSETPHETNAGRVDWGEHHAITAVWGVATGTVRDVTVSWPGGRARVRPVRTYVSFQPKRFRRYNPRGFAVVLDGRIDPARVRVAVRLRDGWVLTRAASSGLVDGSGRPVDWGAQPRYRAPRPLERARRPAAWHAVGAPLGTMRADDPKGGDAWALHVRRAATPTGTRGTCLLLVRLDGRGRERAALGDDLAPRPVAPGTLGHCTRDAYRSGVALINTRTPLRRAASDRPTATSTALFGLLPRGATQVAVRGSGVPSRLRGGPGGALLFVGRAADLHPYGLVLRPLDRDGRPTSHGARTPQSVRPDATARIDARAPDPDGGAPWGILAGARGANCAAIGRIVGDSVGVVDRETGLFRDVGRFRCGGDGARYRHVLVHADVQSYPADGGGGDLRRTLPGRSIVALFAQPRVRRITIRTSRDVRTLVPRGPGHAALAVYDGRLEGSLVIDAVLSDGRRRHIVHPVGG